MTNPYAPPRPGGQGDGPGRDGAERARPEGGAAGEHPDDAARPSPTGTGTGTAGPTPPGPSPEQRPLREWTGAPRPQEPPRPPLDPEVVREATRPVGTVAMLMFATLVVSLLPLPWQPAALVFGLLAVVLGIRSIVRLSRAGLGRSPIIAFLAAGLAFTSLTMLTVGSGVAVWSIQMDHQECVAGALTIAAQEACTQSYQDALESTVSGWTSLLVPEG